MRIFRNAVLASLAVLLCVLFLTASIPNVPTGTWQAWNAMADVRSGASAVLLSDGRVLIVGGSSANGPTASADIFGKDGVFSAAAAMHSPRTNHTATLLSDGRVLVIGGETGSGITNSAEVYDPAAGSWTLLGATLLDARAGHSASLLPDNRVLLAGGYNSGGALSSLEIFDPMNDAFTSAGTLTAPRMNHAAAVLGDGRVLVIGGTTDGTIPLATVDIYDPVTRTVGVGPNLSTPRMAATATTTLDGKVAVIGGSNGSQDLASAEVFDSATGQITLSASSLATARSGHRSFLLPNNNSILIVGGTSAGNDLNSAELYSPWADSFQTTGSMSVARPGLTGSPLSLDGRFLAAGGTNLASTELYGFATVKSDAADYPPGSTVTINGSGWKPGETVTITLVELPLVDTHGPYNVVADGNGNISDSSFVTDDHDLDIRFSVTAEGTQSGSQAQNIFTDAKPNTVTVGTQSPNPVAPGSSTAYTVTVNFNGNGSSCTSPLSVTTALPAGASTSFSPSSVTSTGGNANSTLTISTTNATPPGSTTFTVLAANGGGTCQAGTAANTGTLVVVENTTTTLTSSVNASIFGQSTTLTATVAQTTGSTTPNVGTITFKDGANTLGTVAVNALGGATLPVSTLTAGSHTLTASYGGTVSFGASNSNTVTQTVNQASTTTNVALTTGTSPSVSGQSLTFSATVAAVAPGAGTPTGSVTFKDSAATIGTGTLNGSGVATLTTTTLAVGAHSITTVYAGDTNFTTSTSSSLSQTVNPAGTTTTITSYTPSPSVVGQTVTINFTVAAVAPGSGTPTGTVTVSDGTLNCSASVATGSCSITFTTTGTRPLTASYAGDTNFNSSTSTPATSHTVNAAATTTTITAHTPNPSLVNQAITVNFTVTVNLPGTGTPTGNVTVSDGTSNCTATVAAATCQLMPTTAGAKTLTTSYATDGTFASSTSAGVSHTVNQAPTITSANNTTFKVGTAGSFTVTATGFPASTFTETGALPSGVTLSSAGVLNGTPAAGTGGTYSITITANNGVTPNATQSFTLTVNQAPAITSASSASFIVSQAASFTVTATGFPAPTFSETGALPAGITLDPTTGVLGGTPTVTGNFPITITANNGVTPNATQSFTLTVGQPPAITSANNATFTVNTAGSFTVAATGFPAPSFTETGALPSGVTLTSAGVLSGTPALGTVGTYPITITASNGVGTNATQSFSLTVNKITPTFAGLTASQSIAFGTASISLSGRLNGFPMMPGSVTITINSVPVSGIALNGNPNNFGPVTFNTSTIPASTTPYIITYTYSGDANSNSASDTSTALTVNKATTTFSALASHTITFGTASVALSGTIAAGSLFPPNGETVNITINSVTTLATIGANGAFSAVVDTHAIPASITPYTVTYSYAGDSNFSAASNTATTLTVNKATSTTTLVSSLNPSFSGQQVTFTATVAAASGVPTGGVQFQDGGVNFGSPGTLINNGGIFTAQLQTSTLSVGTHNITAIYGGDGNVSGSNSNTVAQPVKSAETTTSISAPAITFGADGMVTVTVVAQDSSAGTPNGSVSLSVDGGTPSSQALVNGSTTFTISHPSAGDHSLSASYAAQNSFNASSATGTLHVDQALAAVVLSNLNQTYDAGPKSVTVSTVPTDLSLSVTYNGSATAPTSAGSYGIVVTVLDSNYTGGATGTLVISKATPTINWSNPADINYGTALSGTQLNATATFNANQVAGSFTYNPATGTVLPAGDGQTLSADFVPNDAANLNSVSGTTVLINVKTDPLYVISSDGLRAFGDPNPIFTPTFIGLVTGDSFTTTCSSAAGSTSAPGTYAATCAPVTANNYSVHYISGTLTITNPVTAITAVKDSQSHISETLEIGQTEQLTATGQFKDTSSRDLAASGGSSYAKADLNTAVSGAAVAEAGGVLYAIGGLDGSSVVTTIQAYDPKNNTWSVSGAALATARMNAAVASVAGKIYVIGGNNGSGQLNSIEVLDTTTGTPVVSGFAGSMATARSNAAAAVLNQKLYVVGGSNGSGLTSVDIFDLVTGTSATGNAPTAFDQASASVLNNKLYVLGTTSSAVKLITFDGTSWSGASSTSLDATKGVGAVAFNNVLYAINGDTVRAYDGSNFIPQNSLSNSHNGSQPAGIGSLIYVGSENGAMSNKLDAFAPIEVTWSSTGPNAADASIDQAGHITALARTDESTPTWVTLTATSQADNTITGSFQLTVVRKSQTITFSALANGTYGDADFGVTATVTSGLTVTFTASGYCSVSGSMVHITGAGSCTITAHQDGDDTTWAGALEVPQSFSIAKATPTVAVSFAASPISYDGDSHAATAVVTGVNNTVLGSGDGTTTVSYTKGGNPFNGTPTDADNYTASAHFASNSDNYTDANSTVPALLTINRADPVVTAAGGTFTYDANPHAGSGTAVGVKGESLTPVNVAYKDALNNLLTSAPVNAGTYSVAARYAGDSNYNPQQSVPASLIINKANSTTTVTVAGGERFTYDGNSHPAMVSVAGVGGLSLTPDPVYSCGHAPINVADSGCTASYTFTGDNNHNGSSDFKTYAIAKATSTTVVTVPGAESFTYDGNSHPATVSVTGVGGLNLTPVPTYSCGHTPVDVVDSGCIASYTYAGDSNHNGSSDSKTYAIAKAASTTVVTVPGGESFTYDGNSHPATVSVTGVGGLNLTPAPSYGCGHVPVDVADSGCIASYNYTGDANHNSSSDSKTYTISKATPAVTATATDAIYNGSPYTGASGSATGVKGENLTPAVTLRYAGTGSTTYGPSTTAPTDAGTYSVRVSFVGNGNYIAGGANAAFTINKADSTTTVTVAGGESFTYDGNAHPAAVSVTGVGGLNLTPAPVYSCGHAPINVADSGCTSSYSYTGDGNHNSSSDSKTYTINPAASMTVVTVTGGESFIFDGNAHPATVSVTGVGGLNQTPAPTYSCGHAPANVVDSGCTASYTFSGDANHTSSTDTKTYAIAKASSTTSVTGGTFVFDGLPHPATVSVTGVGGLSMTATPTYSGGCVAAPVNVVETQPAPCTASYTFSSDANHNGSTGSATVLINKAPSSTTIGAGYTVTYDGLPHSVAASVTGAGVLNQSLVVTYNPGGTTAPINAGTYSASANFAGDPNHLGGSAGPVTITINKAQLTITAVNKSKLLNAGNPALTANYAGFLNGEGTANLTGSLSCTTTAVTNSPVGSYPITCAGQTSNNYAITYVPGTLKITYAAGGACAGDVGHQVRQPINVDGTSVWKQNATIPAKFAVCDANGVSIGTPGVVSGFFLTQIISGTITTTVNEVPDSTTPDTAFRWDPTGQQWIYNINSKAAPVNKANQTYAFTITLNDGSAIMFQFGLR